MPVLGVSKRTYSIRERPPTVHKRADGVTVTTLRSEFEIVSHSKLRDTVLARHTSKAAAEAGLARIKRPWG